MHKLENENVVTFIFEIQRSEKWYFYHNAHTVFERCLQILIFKDIQQHFKEYQTYLKA